jgi:hypothetical protein
MSNLFFIKSTFICPHCSKQIGDVILNGCSEGIRHQFYFCDKEQAGCGKKIILESEITIVLNAYKIPGKEATANDQETNGLD